MQKNDPSPATRARVGRANVEDDTNRPSTPEGVETRSLASPELITGLTDAVHSALLAAAEGWAVTQEDGPGEEDRPYRFANPAESSVAATVSVTAVVEHLQEFFSQRRAKVPPDVVNRVLADVTYRPGWSFETTVLPDGNTGILVVAELEDLNHPGRVFRTSRIAPLLASGHSAPARVILEGVLRGVLAIEEHEVREQLRYRGDQLLDLHELPVPTSNRIPR
jgi:hypothetical protein